MPWVFFYGADMFIGWTEFQSPDGVPSEPSKLGLEGDPKRSASVLAIEDQSERGE